ncbi:TetR/AcrR family transcriptional regulator [Paenibacillus cellulosilyticus]|uniref:TetR/AcrR family transcriptional regulator n=2 Tax=Paenibacillus cellulosilyticus TaxID=375489 RepID=UPI001FEE402D|nr:TetR/AcrR family transcriptional regulator [Paenibacillus cellulosilyticus]
MLHKAMLVFWAKGYEATSMPDLLQAMDLSRSSLYETFTDKETLYLEAIERYKSISQSKRALLQSAPSAKEGIRRYFDRQVSNALDEASPHGCLITNATVGMESPDEQVRAAIRDSFDGLEQCYIDVLRRGQQAGEIAPDKDVQTMATLLLNLNHGINVVTKMKPDRKLYDDMIEAVLNML